MKDFITVTMEAISHGGRYVEPFNHRQKKKSVLTTMASVGITRAPCKFQYKCSSLVQLNNTLGHFAIIRLAGKPQWKCQQKGQ